MIRRLFSTLILPTLSLAAVYNVGPGQPLATIGAVPWATLQPGDTVRIHYRATPYREKWVICRQGTAALPITVTGVPGPSGQLPIIEGISAVTAPGLSYWAETRGVIKIGGASVPADTMPKHIIIEKLEVRGARHTYTFRDDTGATVSYLDNASTIYVEKCENCTIRDNVLHDGGNGLFVASTDSAVSRNILIQRNYIHGSGVVGSIREHNVYTAAAGIVFEGNRLGLLRPGATGNNLKDRSSGSVFRYNWIEGGNRQLDLTDAEDAAAIRNDPAYSTTLVYGNVLIEPAGAGNRQMIHYGGDSGSTAIYRKGTMHLYNNTFISTRTDRTTLMRLSTNDERVDARNNIFYTTLAGTTIALGDASGVYYLSRNWIKSGWRNTFGTWSGVVNDDGTWVNGDAPGFVSESGQDYDLTASSACINRGGNLSSAVLPAHNVTSQYVKHAALEARAVSGLFDIGAYEYGQAGGGGGTGAPVAIMTATPASGIVPVNVVFDGSGSYDPDGTVASYRWDYGDAAVGTGVRRAHKYNVVGTYTALLRVTDNSGATGQVTQTITVNPLPAPSLTGVRSGATVQLTWTDASGGKATGWRVERRLGTGAWTALADLTVRTYSTPLGSWSYRVRSYNAVAESAYSNIVTP